MEEQKEMPKGWDDLDPLAKAGYVDANFVEAVDDAMFQASLEIQKRKEETENMNDEEYEKFCMQIMREYVDPV